MWFWQVRKCEKKKKKKEKGLINEYSETWGVCLGKRLQRVRGKRGKRK